MNVDWGGGSVLIWLCEQGINLVESQNTALKIPGSTYLRRCFKGYSLKTGWKV